MESAVDTETARVFMAQTMEKVGPGELEETCSLLETKSALFRERLEPGTISTLSAAGMGELLDCVFSVRGASRKKLDAFDHDTLRSWVAELVHADDPVEARFLGFTGRPELSTVPVNVRRDLASELLHFRDPEGPWLWTRWMWDPKTRTGALPLVTSVSYEYDGETDADVYVRVGNAVRFVQEIGSAAGFTQLTHSVFGTDVFLSCIYVIYAYTVLGMRMTQEFNKVMPELPEFSRRLLGVNMRKVAR